jgi:nitrogen regulatory protein P-II 1
MQMVVLVLDDLQKVARVLEAWREAGVSGITIWDSRGQGRTLHYRRLLDDIPLMPSLDWLLQPREDDHCTLFTLVDCEELVDRLIDVTEAITGSLDNENRGILFVLPVLRTVGVRSTREQSLDAVAGLN